MQDVTPTTPLSKLPAAGLRLHNLEFAVQRSPSKKRLTGRDKRPLEEEEGEESGVARKRKLSEGGRRPLVPEKSANVAFAPSRFKSFTARPKVAEPDAPRKKVVTIAETPVATEEEPSTHVAFDLLHRWQSQPSVHLDSIKESEQDARQWTTVPASVGPSPYKELVDLHVTDEESISTAVTEESEEQMVVAHTAEVANAPVASAPLGEMPCNLADPFFGLPAPVVRQYAALGVQEMYPWQSEALHLPDVLKKGRNLVYYAPTSAGKTFVAEILLLKRFLATGRKAIFVLPYVALVTEKVQFLQQLWQNPKIRVAGFYAGRVEHWDHLDVAVCTTEKANSLFNRLIEENRVDEISTIVVDELHMVGQKERGTLLELLLTKMRILMEEQVQIIGMSATVSNLPTLAKWLNAACYETQYRPVPLTEYILYNGVVYDGALNVYREFPYEKRPDDKGQLVPLCWETLSTGGQVLLFISSKQQCESCSRLLQRLLDTGVPDETVLQRRSQVVAALQRCAGINANHTDRALYTCVAHGIAWHHAGLTVEEREIIESAFHQGTLLILCATSTVAAGVNLPARRVIFRNVTMGQRRLEPNEYQQMKGRAGRKGKDPFGESMLICETEKEFQAAAALVKATLPPVRSGLMMSQSGLQRALLESMMANIVQSYGDVLRFFRFSLLSADLSDAELTEHTEKAVLDLVEQGFITLEQKEDGREVDLKESMLLPTKLGRACIAASMSPDKAIKVYQYLDEAMDKISLSSDLHMIYLVTPMGLDLQPDWSRFLTIFEQLSEKERNVASIVGVSHGTLCQVAANPSYLQGASNAKQTRRWEKYRRFWASLILNQLVQEVPAEQIVASFGIHRGTLQTLQNSVAVMAGQITIFAQRLDWERIRLLVKDFQSRLIFGVERELVELMQLPQVKASHARALWAAGLRTFADIASAEEEHIHEILVRHQPFRQQDTTPSTVERRVASLIHQSALQMTHIEAIALQKKLKKIHQKKQKKLPATKHVRLLSVLQQTQIENPDVTLSNVSSGVQEEEELWHPIEMVRYDVTMMPHSFMTVTFHLQPIAFVVHTGGGEEGDQSILFEDVSAFFTFWQNATLLNISFLFPDLVEQWRMLRLLYPTEVPFFAYDESAPTMLCPTVAEWLLSANDGSSPSLRHMMKEYLPHYVSKFKRPTSIAEKLAQDTWQTSLLMSFFKLKLQSMQLWQHYMSIEMPIARLMGEMAATGVSFDLDRLQQSLSAIEAHRTALEEEANRLAGRVVNLDSPKEGFLFLFLASEQELTGKIKVATVLYDVLALPLNGVGMPPGAVKRLKRRTSSDVLLKLSTDDAVGIVMRYRRIAHIDVKCLRPFITQAKKQAGHYRLHCHYQMRSSTGRIYTTDPNLQCMPHPVDLDTFEKMADGGDASLNFRAAIRASPGHSMLMIDFHQLELRIVAHISQDAALQAFFAQSSDVFAAMAETWFGPAESAAVLAEQRAKAKRTTYAILYGTGAEGLANTLNITVEEACELIADFRTRYPSILDMKKHIIEKGQTLGYVETLTGRRRHLPDLTSKVAQVAQKAERVAVNTVIQGTASDIVKYAMLRVSAALAASSETEGAKLVLQIHDELLFDVPNAVFAVATALVKQTLEMAPAFLTVTNMHFPIRMKVGPSWGELTDYTPVP